MLLEALQRLQPNIDEQVSLENIILRSFLAFLTALIIGLFAGPWTINKLSDMRMGQAIRAYGPMPHLFKLGTPTMGGLLILASVISSTLLWTHWHNRFLWVVLVTMSCLGYLGWFDDYNKVVFRNPEGISSGKKFFWQLIISIPASAYIVFTILIPDEVPVWSLLGMWMNNGIETNLLNDPKLLIPFFKTIDYPLGTLGFFILTLCVIVGTSNAVNLTDGLDGLVIIPAIMISTAFGIFAYTAGQSSTPFVLPHASDVAELSILSAAITGAGLAFLWFNTHPALIFMGDVGSLALGGALGSIAVITRQELILFIMGGVFVIEALSVILQVTYFKYTKFRYGKGKRIFRIAPIHHYFETVGWKETQIVVRFWIISAVLVFIGLLVFQLQQNNM